MSWILVVFSCKPEPALPEGEVREITAQIASSPEVPSVLWVTVDAPGATAAWVEYGLDNPDHTTPAVEPVAPVIVQGVKAGTPIAWRAVAEFDDGTTGVSPISTFDVPSPPAAITSYDVVVPGDGLDGFVLTSIIDLTAGTSWTGILDRDGDWVWWVQAPPGTIHLSSRLSHDGTAIEWGEYDLDKSPTGTDVGAMVSVDLAGGGRSRTRLFSGHHNALAHSDGTVAFLALEFAPIQFGPDTWHMAADRIQEVPLGATDEDVPDVVFSSFDDYPFEPTVTCSHVSTPEYKFGSQVYEWSHGNSLAYVASEDAYYLNAKTTDWLFKIDRASGALIWQMNGINGDFAAPNGQLVWEGPDNPLLWSHGHMSQVWPGGVMVFDNGDHRDDRVSTLVEIAWDEATMTAERVWEFPHPTGGYTASMGDVRKLPSGNVLSAWSGLGQIMEVTQDHQIVWELAGAPDDTMGRVTWIEDLYAPEPDRGLDPLTR